MFKLFLILTLISSFNIAMANSVYEEAVKLHKQQKYTLALAKFKQASKNGDTNAGFAVATMYYYGDGIKQDFNKAKKWLYIFADKGHSQSQALLGLMAKKGEGGEVDIDEAIRWMERAAAQCDVTAQSWVAELYWTAQPEYKDKVKAYVWSAMASLQGSEDSLELMVKSKESLNGTELEKANVLIQFIKSKNKCLTKKPQQ